MPLYCTVTLPASSGIPKDAAVNAFMFNTDPAPGAPEFAAIDAALSDFYAVGVAPQPAVGSFLADKLDRTANKVTVDIYDATGHLTPVPGVGMGSPVHTSRFTLPAPGTANSWTPAEVAAVLSIHADLTNVVQEVGGTRPAKRRMGRIYLGPLTNATLQHDGTTGEVRFSSNFRTAIVTSANALMTRAALTALGIHWAVWSRKDGASRPVVGGFVDDAFDTMRKRGVVATARTSFGT